MKWGIYILKFSIAVLAVAPFLYFALYCYDDGPDPIEIETILTFAFAATGIVLGLVLVRQAYSIRAWVFWVLFILYLHTFAIPALLAIIFLLLFI